MLGSKDLDCEMVVGNCYMPATLVWDQGQSVTEYGREVFGELLFSECYEDSDGDLIIECRNIDMGVRFAWAAAGYISGRLYDRLFND